MDVRKTLDEYVFMLAIDETKTLGIRFILVYMTKDNNINYSIANELEVLIDEYKYDDLTPENALKIELKKVKSTIGAIYEKKEKKFELLVKKGF